MADAPTARRKPAGLRDVAALAGVSMGTVSNVLNRPHAVAPDTRERVENAIKELNFVGSHAAVQFRSGRSELLGVVLPDVGNPFWGDVLRGIESVTDEAEVFPVVSSTHQDAAREDRALLSFLSRQVNGLLYAPSAAGSASLSAYLQRDVPVVIFEHALADSSIPSVYGDNVAGGRVAAAHLLSLGHRRIVLVNGPRTVSWSRDRRAGALEALEDAGASPEDLLEVVVGDLTADQGEAAVDRVLALIPDGGAIMCGNDLVALGVLRGLLARGRHVPEEFSLVGYDDVEFARALSPALTTVRQPSFEMGQLAATMLLHPEPGEPVHAAFQPELVLRSSTAPIPGSTGR
ncbi:LacI family DNA-binding transcriptional regulator [Amnibacterium sp. CER49]|uniref:LacI family DNA-binding transcriptional regulator n=1 Tax=Amnibacterium sp. CER49 TaxID=3039161 RepID=UPI0024490D07|nr:LacI family DNA-binding transcriptional regulator [Amnibacterium sp. CER49]MDH2443325.1 LacI family DNA-binding transcriptional regulator [Amnibacterium sp. CER49]